MQVSWIDPDEVAALAESLRPSSPKSSPSTVAELPAPETVDPLVREGPPPAAPTPTGEGQSTLDMDAFRERLQKLRERAIQAGLMTPRAVTAASPAPAPEEDRPALPQPAPDPQPVAEVPSPFEAQPSPVSAPEPSFPVVPQPATEDERAKLQDEASFSQPAPGPSPEPTPYQAWPSAPSMETASHPEPGFDLPADASVKDRLEAFASWTVRRGIQGELLIVDEYGDLLWGPPKKSGLVLSTMMAWNAAIRASAQAASGVAQIRQQLLPAGETLTLIPCQSRLGLLQIALVTLHSPQEEESVTMRQTLLHLMDLGR